jgi:hypothetical protein
MEWLKRAVQKDMTLGSDSLDDELTLFEKPEFESLMETSSRP